MPTLDDTVVKFCLINDNIELHFEEVNSTISTSYILGVRACCLPRIPTTTAVRVIRNKFSSKIKTSKGLRIN